jgi:hypothetical protein
MKKEVAPSTLKGLYFSTIREAVFNPECPNYPIFAEMTKKLGIIILLLMPLIGISQDSVRAKKVLDTVVMNNGAVIATHVVDTLAGTIIIEDPKSKKHKKIELDRDDVFSIKLASNGKEEVFYIYDTLIGHDFTEDEVRKFIAGEQDAQRGFHPVGVSILAFTIGFASGATIGSVVAFGPPFLFDGIMSYPTIKVRKKSVRDMKIATTDPYLYGYDQVARKKRTLHSILWSGIGLAVGLVVNQILINNP